MTSNYERIGKHIQIVKEKNIDLTVTNLLGINIDKFFMPSVANTVGTNLGNYKLVKKGQFACNRMHVGRDYRIPIALSTSDIPFIVSPAYDVFEVKYTSELLPEYLMMWFSRREFDRNAWFYTDADVRGGLPWESFCNIELPIISKEKQQQIINEYGTVDNRIKLNETIIQKLEETAQTIYKHWFEDFEFPDNMGNPYKSSGGEIVKNDEIGKELPKGWKYVDIQHLIDNNIIYRNQDGNHGEIHPKSSDFTNEGVPFIMAKDLHQGTLNLKECKFISEDQATKLRIHPAKSNDILLTHKATMGRVAIIPTYNGPVVLTPQVTYYRIKDELRMNKEFLYCLFHSFDFQSNLLGDSEQSTRKFVSITNQRLIKVILPPGNIIQDFKNVVFHIFCHKQYKIEENYLLQNLKITLGKRLSSKHK